MSLVNRIAGFVAQITAAEPPKEAQKAKPVTTAPQKPASPPDQDQYVDGGRYGHPVRKTPAQPKHPEPAGGPGKRW
ncbi:MAG: hypothetical protein HY696_13070 [Deltaproteobacteria bacterium]|nr:hypothetical protein [Deltaproteobacteria bacterium]